MRVSNIGGNLQGQHLNLLCYADDATLISTCSAEMETLLQLCDKYTEEHDLIV